MCVPVSEPDRWSTLGNALTETLDYLSGDRWSFQFCKAESHLEEVPLSFDPNQDMGNPDVLCMLSGGLDSLCAAVEAVHAGDHPLLIGHEPAPHIKRRRDDLVHALRTRFTSWQFPDVSASIHRVGPGDPPETTHRTRSFLYASLGVVFASRLGIRQVLLPDNGVVSVNLPINGQLVGTLASRSTHPKFIRLLNDFVGQLLPTGPVVHNPLWSRTRTETLDVLKTAGAADLIALTNSCARSRRLKSDQDHCGTCSQCVDRRFATVSAGLGAHDPSTRYVTDCFRGALDEDAARVTVLGYHDFAVKVSELSGDGLLQEFDALAEAIPVNDASQRLVGEGLIDMLHRHAEATISVIRGQIVQASDELARKKLPPNCLLTLLGSRYSERRPVLVYLHSESYQSVTYRDANYSFSPAQACVVRFLDEARQDGPPMRRHKAICDYLQLEGFGTKRLSDLFPGHPAWGPFIQNPTRGQYQLPRDLPL
jgi:7-cyano-7-deazaguanine synthase in queuosine biosynthesis